MKTSFMDIQEGDDGNIITLNGASFEPEQISEIKNQVSSLVEGGKRNFVADMGNLKIMNSTVSSMLIVSMKKARAAGGDVILANVPAAIMRQLDIAKLTSVFTITETIAQALAKLKAQPGAS